MLVKVSFNIFSNCTILVSSVQIQMFDWCLIYEWRGLWKVKIYLLKHNQYSLKVVNRKLKERYQKMIVLCNISPLLFLFYPLRTLEIAEWGDMNHYSQCEQSTPYLRNASASKNLSILQRLIAIIFTFHPT